MRECACVCQVYGSGQEGTLICSCTGAMVADSPEPRCVALAFRVYEAERRVGSAHPGSDRVCSRGQVLRTELRPVGGTEGSGEL